MARKAATRRARPKSLDRLEPFEDGCVLVVIETPKGSPNKLAFEARFGTFVLKGVLPAGAVFPFDFGFVPSTRAEDGDPLDVLVLMDAPVFPGCVVPSRLVGVIEAERTEDGKTERNDRVLAVAANYASIHSRAARSQPRSRCANRALLRLVQRDEGEAVSREAPRRKETRVDAGDGSPHQATEP